MSFPRPIQWYHSHADPIWPDGTFKSDDVVLLFCLGGGRGASVRGGGRPVR